jgi:hypothetical protein
MHTLYRLLVFFFSIMLFSCSEIIFEKNISEKSTTLIAPMDNAKFYTTGVTFTWEALPDATKYQLQIAKPSFASPLQIILDTSITATTFTQQLPIGQYEWRVRAINAAYSTSYSSRFIDVVNNSDFASNVVILSSPIDNLITKTALQSLTWQPILGATGYQVQILDGSTTVVNDQTITATTLSYTFLQGNFQWRVRANNGTQQTVYSSRSVLLDTTVPNTPVLSTPANASTTAVKDVSFNWNRTSIVGSVESDSIYIYTNNALTALQLKNVATSPFNTTLTTGTYYWFMKSFDKAGNTSAKSTVFSFTVN